MGKDPHPKGGHRWKETTGGGRGPLGGTIPDLTVPVAPRQSRRLQEDHRGERFSYQLTAHSGSVAFFSISRTGRSNQ